MFRTACSHLALLLALLVSPACAAEPASDTTPADGPLVALMDGLGDYEMPITTREPLAQQYFNQGVRLMYAFNHDEAIRAFRAAAKLDPTCAMAHWGISLALGTNYNQPMNEEMGQAAFAELAEAKKLSSGATPKEQAFIEALSARYADPPPAERKELDEAYSAAMRKLAQAYPDDLDAATLSAEAMMDLRPGSCGTSMASPSRARKKSSRRSKVCWRGIPNIRAPIISTFTPWRWACRPRESRRRNDWGRSPLARATWFTCPRTSSFG